MAILSFLVTEPTGVVGDLPRRGKILTTDSYATVTAAGYLNGINTQGQPVMPNDVFDVQYNYVSPSNPGTFVQLVASVSAGVITLNATAGDVILPVVSGDIPKFSGTNGAIADSGVAFSNGTDTVAPLFHGTATAGDFVTVNNANKTIQDSGAAPSAASQPFVAMSPGSMTTGHLLKTSDANGTLADQGVQMKSVAQAAVAGGAAAQTVTDAFCTTGSCVVASWNDTTNPVEIETVAAGNGSFVVTSTADPGASHLNYVIFKT